MDMPGCFFPASAKYPKRKRQSVNKVEHEDFFLAMFIYRSLYQGYTYLYYIYFLFLYRSKWSCDCESTMCDILHISYVPRRNGILSRAFVLFVSSSRYCNSFWSLQPDLGIDNLHVWILWWLLRKRIQNMFLLEHVFCCFQASFLSRKNKKEVFLRIESN